MKKFFTLIAAALFSSGAFAQTEWVDLVVNGNMEGAADPMWSCFWCHDWRTDVEFNPESGQQYDGNGQFQGFAEIVEDPTNPENHCARVICRSQAEAEAAGNMVADGDHIAGWDSQFFVYATEQIPAGKELRLTMRIMAEKEASPGSQAHCTPGDYNHWACVGNPNFTTQWEKWTSTITVSNDMVGGVDEDGNATKGFQAIAFNLADFRDGNIYYFDDIKLEIRDPKGPEEFTGWFNMLRHGTLSADKIGNFTNFTGRMGIDNTDRPGIVVNDPLDGEPALTVTSIAFNHQIVTRKEVLDEENNPVLDENGNPTYEEEVFNYYKNEETGDSLSSIDDWRTQFFVTGPHKFAANSKYRLKMWARADKDCTIQSQVHRMPGDYIHYVGVGDLNLTPEWQLFEFDDMTVSSDQSGSGSMQTIAFNCNVKKDEPVTMYFRFEEFCANAADVTEAERVLDSESVMLPVPEPEKKEGAVGTIDFNNCIATLEANSFENLVNEKMAVQSGEDAFAPIDATAGFYLKDNGWLSFEESDLTVEVDEVSNDNPVLTLITYNDGESFAGKSLNTQFRYEFNKWFYIFDVNLVPEEVYSGVSEVKTQQPMQNVIYDLSGRRVKQANKGLYIINGKKYLVK